MSDQSTDTEKVWGSWVREDYTDHFDADDYLQLLYDPSSERYAWGVDLLRQFHVMFQTGDHKGDVLLDMCSGPSILSGISASKYYKQIYLSDFAPSSLIALKKWVSRDDAAFDWTPYFEMASKLEGDGITGLEIENRVRTSIKGILPCDITAEKPLGPEQGNYEMADAIISCLTINAVTTDEEIYLVTLKKLYDILAPGGLLCLVCDLENGTYTTRSNKTFYAHGFSKETTNGKLSEAGFCNIKSLPQGIDKVMYFVYATKKSN